MKATKVAVLLALIALSALTLFVITLIDGSVFGAEVPTGGQTYIGPDGHVNIEVQLLRREGGSGDLLPLLALKNSHDFKTLSGPSLLDLPLEGRGQSPDLNLSGQS